MDEIKKENLEWMSNRIRTEHSKYHMVENPVNWSEMAALKVIATLQDKYDFVEKRKTIEDGQR